MAQITIDTRESALISLMPEARILQLDVGDIHVSCKQKFERLVIIELKQVADLQSSVIDGRYKEQRFRLLASLRKNGGSADAILYVVQGCVPQPKDCRIDVQNVITSLICRFGIPVYHTNDINETVKFINAIAHRVQKMSEIPDPNPPAKESYQRSGCLVHTTKKRNLFEPQALWIAQLQCIPGVSANIAAAITLNFSKSAVDLLDRIRNERAQTEQNLAQLEITSLTGKKQRTIGIVLAKRIAAAVLGEKMSEPCEKKQKTL